MNEQRNILVIVDPSRDQQPALERLISAAGNRGESPSVTVFMAVDHESLGRGEGRSLERGEEWILEILGRLKEANIDHKIVTSWNLEWSSTVLDLVKEHGVDTLMVSVFADDDGDNLLSNEMWALIRNAATKTLFVRNDSNTNARARVLAAIKMQDAAVAELNGRVLDSLRFTSQISENESFVANIYESSMDYPDRAKLLELTGLPNENIYVEQGDPAKTIANAQEKFGADLVIIGIRPKPLIRDRFRGKTIDRILKAVHCDVMAVP